MVVSNGYFFTFYRLWRPETIAVARNHRRSTNLSTAYGGLKLGESRTGHCEVLPFYRLWRPETLTANASRLAVAAFLPPMAA